ncbi:MAG TPA: hypothetical protein VMT70_23315 [Vicinamibacteria bacterium]|nr:hypothetical protein [Vicinamibacteria bacterium]
MGKPRWLDAPSAATAGHAGVVPSRKGRFLGALALLALVAGILISIPLYPPAVVGDVVAAIALVARLGLTASAAEPDERSAP